eukprot:symbB.v1.2.030280.t2/scaffold3396.1/size57705/2
MMKSMAMVVPKKGRGRQVLKWPGALKRSKRNKKDDVKYVRTVSHTAIRVDQVKWRRSLLELLAATDFGIIRLLQKDKILPQWSGHKWPRCTKGTLSPLLRRPGRETYAYRCRAQGCQCCVNPQHLHPLFVEYDGGNGGQEQSADASCFADVDSLAPMLPSTACSTSATKPSKTWRQGSGRFAERQRQMDLAPIPTNVKTMEHKLPGGMTLQVKAGTQVIDRCWRYIKGRIVINQNSRAGSVALRAQLRSAQWRYWHRNDDLLGILSEAQLVEIYNDQLRDLLAEGVEQPRLRLSVSSSGSALLGAVSQHISADSQGGIAKTLGQVLRMGQAQRATFNTALNVRLYAGDASASRELEAFQLSPGALDLSTKWLKSSIPEVQFFAASTICRIASAQDSQVDIQWLLQQAILATEIEKPYPSFFHDCILQSLQEGTTHFAVVFFPKDLDFNKNLEVGMTTAMTVSHAVSHGRTRGCVTRGATLEAPAAAAATVDSSAALLPAEAFVCCCAAASTFEESTEERGTADLSIGIVKVGTLRGADRRFESFVTTWSSRSYRCSPGDEEAKAGDDPLQCGNFSPWHQDVDGDAVLLFHSMELWRIQRSSVSFNVCAKALEKGSQWQMAIRIFEDLTKSSLPPDMFSYGIALKSLEKGHQWQLALQLFYDIPSDVVDVVCWNSVMAACATGDAWRFTLELFTSSPIKDVVTYGHLASKIPWGLPRWGWVRSPNRISGVELRS